jgi:hypothetical protein
VPFSQDAADIETDIVETPSQVQLDSLRRLAESGGFQRPGQTLAIIRSTPPNRTASFRLERGRDEPPNKTQRPYWLKRVCCRRKSTICDKWASCSATNSST